MKEGRKKRAPKLKSFEEYISKKEFQKGTPVWLNVYHLTWLNYLLQLIGLGIYHSAIEIDSYEYSFGASEEDVAGFYINKIGEISKKLRLKEKIYMGNTIYSKNNIERLLALESPYWMGRTYDPFLKNCNNFTKHFLKIILFDKIIYPSYINRIIKYTTIFSNFYPPIKRLYGNLHKRDTCGSVSHLAEEINYFLKKNSNVSNTNTQSVNYIENEIQVSRAPIVFDNLKNDEKYFSEKEKEFDKKKSIDNPSITDSLDKSTSYLLDEETKSRLNLYCPKLLRYMNKDPFLYSLDYSSLYKTEVQGKRQIDIKIETIYNFFKHLQEANDKLIKVCNINQNINSIFNINNLNYNYNQTYIFDKNNISDFNKLNEDIDTCYFLLGILIKDKSFLNKDIKINFDTFIKDNYNIFPGNLIINNKLIDIETFLSLKILHMRNFIYFVNKNLERQKDSVEKILLFDQNDFFGLYSLAYIRLVQSYIPESYELITSMLNRKEIVDVPSYNMALNCMKNIIDNNIA